MTVIFIIVLVCFVFALYYSFRFFNELDTELLDEPIPPGVYDTDDQPFEHLFINDDKIKP